MTTSGPSDARALAKDRGVLLDDRCERNDVDNAAKIMQPRMFEREGKRGKSLSAASRNSERE